MAGGDPYNYPPRGLSRAEGARYVGVGVTKWDELVSDGRMPKPRKIDNRSVWDRLEVDAAFSDLPGPGVLLDDLLNGQS